MPGLLDTSTMNPLGTMATQREVSDEELTSYQTNKLLSKDSPLRQTAEASGKNYATGRGLLNSDLGAQATFGAFIDRVTPIANADATAFGGVADKNFAAENDFKMADKNFGFNASLQKDDQAWRSSENSLDRRQQSRLQDNQQKWASGENTADRNNAIELQKMRDKAAMDQLVLSINSELARMGYSHKLTMAQAGSAAANSIYTSAAAEINAIITNPDLTPEARDGAIANIVASSNASINTIAIANNVTAYTVTEPGGTPEVVNPGAQTPDAPVVTPPESSFMANYAESMGYNATPAEIAQAEQIARDAGMTPLQQREFIDRELAARGL